MPPIRQGRKGAALGLDALIGLAGHDGQYGDLSLGKWFVHMSMGGLVVVTLIPVGLEGCRVNQSIDQLLVLRRREIDQCCGTGPTDCSCGNGQDNVVPHVLDLNISHALILPAVSVLGSTQ